MPKFAKNPNAEITFELSEHELEYLKRLHHARALKELTLHPGWEIYVEILDRMLIRLERQHLDLSTGSSRDAYWMSGIRLGGVREFVKILKEKITGSIDLLNQPLMPPDPTLEMAELDGEFIPGSNGNGSIL